MQKFSVSSSSPDYHRKSPLQSQSNLFSIENILNSQKSITVIKEENDTDEDSSPSPPNSTTGYTLDSLQNLDRRSLNKKKWVTTHRALDSPHAKQCPHCDRVYVSMPALRYV
ncbi:hypothetical protein CAEBREN_32011 [Caenorhabditis brenneri]|uniref:Uncharacterized protein n=1 Tax=Caenorhabditis brenneri TaxID=135651 RepID=G0PFY1_CAEBE|nr:hypothetical protein CAEBREN_32011 [Caenorhabditis brenneri]